MPVVRIRRILMTAIVLASTLIIVLVWTGCMNLGISLTDTSHRDSLLSAVIEVTANIGAVALAVIFLTAQLSASRSRPSILVELYRNADIYILFAAVTLSITCGYAALALGPTAVTTLWLSRLVDTALVASGATVVMICPTIMAQLENLNPLVLAAKLSVRLTPKLIVKYGLTSVDNAGPRDVRYSLVMVGLRPLGVDPFRPIHELLMESVESRDRVLFGKLFRHLLHVVARVHGARWDRSGSTGSSDSGSVLLRWMAKRYSASTRIHVTLAVMHYSVKRARNLLNEWDGKDIGRHGIVTGIADLLGSLACTAGSGPAIRISIFAILRITQLYAAIEPFGRTEPLNILRNAVLTMLKFYPSEAVLCVEVLAWSSVRTLQVTRQRSPHIYNWPHGVLQLAFDLAREASESDETWLPGNRGHDPWTSWLL